MSVKAWETFSQLKLLVLDRNMWKKSDCHINSQKYRWIMPRWIMAFEIQHLSDSKYFKPIIAHVGKTWRYRI